MARYVSAPPFPFPLLITSLCRLFVSKLIRVTSDLASFVIITICSSVSCCLSTQTYSELDVCAYSELVVCD